MYNGSLQNREMLSGEEVKSFRQQVGECEASGNLRHINMQRHLDVVGYKSKVSLPVVLICLKYNDLCHSDLCREEREKIKEE